MPPLFATTPDKGLHLRPIRTYEQFAYGHIKSLNKVQGQQFVDHLGLRPSSFGHA